MAQAAIRGIPAGVETVERTNTKDAIDRMLEEDRKFSARIKLTWNPDKPPGVPNDKMVGEVNLYLPYMSLRRKYYVQNAKIYLSNGEPTNLEYIRLGSGDACQFCLADADSWRNRQKGDVCCAYAEAAMAMDVFMADAITRDPLLCKNKGCGHVSRNVDGYADHRATCAAGVQPVASVEAAENAGVAPMAVKKPMCPYCDKRFKNDLGLKIHLRRMHKDAA